MRMGGGRRRRQCGWRKGRGEEGRDSGCVLLLLLCSLC